MSEVLTVENISKLYRIGQKSGTKLIDFSLKDFVFSKSKEIKYNESLKDVSFSVNEGDSLGVIGKNGAGKSTLLKIISRITKPTSGRIHGKGRVASLLEVGTGFHPELSGYDNIFLNGAILGMSKSEIKDNLDEIIHFSGIEKYIYEPVKRYSSGMYVRLGFAVAAHLNAEILIIDEVLAVGDAEFQKRCIGKINSLSEKDRKTILFVSHNMNAVAQLCNKALILEGGKLTAFGPTIHVIKDYLSSRQLGVNFSAFERRSGSGEAQLTQIECYPSNTNTIESGKELVITLLISCITKSPDAISISINDPSGSRIALLSSKMFDVIFSGKKEITVCFQLAKLSLKTGVYSLNVFLEKNGIVLDWLKDAYSFEVVSDVFYPSKSFISKTGEGLVNLDFIIYEK